MMKTIWKYTLSPDDSEFEMPKDAVVLSVQVQNNEPQLWVLVDPDAEKEKRTFRIYGTGHIIQDDFDGIISVHFN